MCTKDHYSWKSRVFQNHSKESDFKLNKDSKIETLFVFTVKVWRTFMIFNYYLWFWMSWIKWEYENLLNPQSSNLNLSNYELVEWMNSSNYELIEQMNSSNYKLIEWGS